MSIYPSKKTGDFRSEAPEEMVPDGDRMDVTESPASLTEVWPKMVGYWLSDTRFFLMFFFAFFVDYILNLV